MEKTPKFLHFCAQLLEQYLGTIQKFCYWDPMGLWFASALSPKTSCFGDLVSGWWDRHGRPSRGSTVGWHWEHCPWKGVELLIGFPKRQLQKEHIWPFPSLTGLHLQIHLCLSHVAPPQGPSQNQCDTEPPEVWANQSSFLYKATQSLEYHCITEKD